MANKPIPIIEYKAIQCAQIEKRGNSVKCIFLEPTDLETNNLLGKPVYLTLNGTWLGCFVLAEITHLESNNSQLKYTSIENSLLQNNQPLNKIAEGLAQYPLAISGFVEGSINFYNETPTQLICFPLIGYQQLPEGKPTNLHIDLLPPAVRINQLLAMLSTNLGINISPLVEELILPYFGNNPINWPWKTLAAISFEASNGLGLSINSELGTMAEAHTTVAKVHKTTFLSNYSVQTTVTLTLENGGSSSNTGLFFINITDPSQVLLKHEAILNYEVEANSSQTYTLTLEGDGITNDLLSITLVPDNTFVDLNYSISGTIIPKTNEGIMVSQLLENITLGKLFQLIENTTGKQWQWDQYKNSLELLKPVVTNLDSSLLKKAEYSSSTSYLPKRNEIEKTVQVNAFNQYLHLSTVNTVGVQLPSTKNTLPNPSETVSFTQPIFLVKVPETTQIIGVEGYQITSFVPEIFNPETTESPSTNTLALEAEIHVSEMENLLKAGSLSNELNPFKIKELLLKPKENGIFQLKLTAHA